MNYSGTLKQGSVLHQWTLAVMNCFSAVLTLTAECQLELLVLDYNLSDPVAALSFENMLINSVVASIVSTVSSPRKLPVSSSHFLHFYRFKFLHEFEVTMG